MNTVLEKPTYQGAGSRAEVIAVDRFHGEEWKTRQVPAHMAYHAVDYLEALQESTWRLRNLLALTDNAPARKYIMEQIKANEKAMVGV